MLSSSTSMLTPSAGVAGRNGGAGGNGGGGGEGDGVGDKGSPFKVEPLGGTSS
jgi:hypothetical protein